MNTADPARWLARYDERLTSAATRAKEAGALLEKVTGTATSPHRDVTVKVNASGALEELRLTPATRSLEADELARLILDTSRQARASVSDQVTAITSEYFGEGPALSVVRQYQPASAANRDDDDYFANPPEIAT